MTSAAVWHMLSKDPNCTPILRAQVRWSWRGKNVEKKRERAGMCARKVSKAVQSVNVVGSDRNCGAKD